MSMKDKFIDYMGLDSKNISKDELIINNTDNAVFADDKNIIVYGEDLVDNKLAKAKKYVRRT